MIRHKRWLSILSVFLTIAVIAGSFCPVSSAVPLKAAGPEEAVQPSAGITGEEIVAERTENARKFDLGEGRYALDVSLGAIHYKDDYANEKEQWKDIDLTFDKNNQITRAPYILTVDPEKKSFTVYDKKTGNTSSVKLNKVGEKDIQDMPDLQAKNAEISKGKILWSDADIDLDLSITADNTRVSFDWVVKSEKAPHEVEFEIEDGGIPIIYQGADAEGAPVDVVANKNGNIVTETIEKGGTYPKVINPVLDLQVSAGANDGYIILTYLNSKYYYQSSSSLRFGTNIDASYYNVPTYYDAWCRWTGISIPQGSYIGYNSYISLFSNNGSGEGEIYFDDEDNPSAPASYNDYVNRPLTATHVYWDVEEDDSWNNSPSVQVPLQEIIDDSQVDITVIQSMLRHYNSSFEAYVRSYEYAGDYDPRLHIEYMTSPGIPTVITDYLEPADYDWDSATLKGHVYSMGGSDWIDVCFEYKPAGESYIQTPWQTLYTGDSGYFNADITGLTDNTIYYFRAKSYNGNSFTASEHDFSTYPIPPDVRTDYVNNVTRHTVTLWGELQDIGTSQEVQVSFEYRKEGEQQYINTDEITMYNTGDYSIDIPYGYWNPVLDSNTKYFYRAKADDGHTIIYGSERYFTTMPETYFGLSPSSATVWLSDQSHENSSILKANRFQNVVADGTLDEMGIYINTLTHSGYIRLGIYEDDNGAPGDLLYGSGSLSLNAVGWKNISGLNIPVKYGEYYWLAFLTNSTPGGTIGVQPYGDENSVCIKDPYTYGPLPASFPTPTDLKRTRFVMHAHVVPDDDDVTDYGINAQYNYPVPPFLYEAIQSLDYANAFAGAFEDEGWDEAYFNYNSDLNLENAEGYFDASDTVWFSGHGAPGILALRDSTDSTHIYLNKLSIGDADAEWVFLYACETLALDGAQIGDPPYGIDEIRSKDEDGLVAKSLNGCHMICGAQSMLWFDDDYNIGHEVACCLLGIDPYTPRKVWKAWYDGLDSYLDESYVVRILSEDAAYWNDFVDGVETGPVDDVTVDDSYIARTIRCY
jgi:hypothetical protein